MLIDHPQSSRKLERDSITGLSMWYITTLTEHNARKMLENINFKGSKEEAFKLHPESVNSEATALFTRMLKSQYNS